MNKKTKLQNELTESVKANESSVDCCPICKSHFSCALSKESHFKLYPLHVLPASIGMPDDQKEVALTENLDGVRHDRKTR